MLRSEKVATPPLTATVLVPASDAPLVPVPVVIETVTLPAKPVTGFPTASRTATWTAGAMTVPAVVVAGGSMQTTGEAAPATRSEESLVTGGRPVVDPASRYPTPILSIFSVENDATPPDAVAVVIPESVAPLVPVPALMATVIDPANPVAEFSSASSAVTLTAGAIDVPATDVPGCTTNPRWVAGPATTSTFALSVGVRVPEFA